MTGAAFALSVQRRAETSRLETEGTPVTAFVAVTAEDGLPGALEHIPSAESRTFVEHETYCRWRLCRFKLLFQRLLSDHLLKNK